MLLASFFHPPASQGVQAADVIEVTATDLAFNPENIKDRREGRLRFVRAVQLTSGDKRFGGLSGLRINAQGNQLLAVTDKGNWFSARLDMTGFRKPVISDAMIAPILNIDGRPLSSRAHDAEGLAFMANGGGVLVSFERWHRVWRYPVSLSSGSLRRVWQAAPSPVALGPVLSHQPGNGGVEAMTMLSDGRLLLLSEKMRDDSDRDMRKGWLVTGNKPEPFDIILPGGHDPVDAATMANGDIMLLLRRYSFWSGISIKLAVLPRSELAAGRPARVKEIASLRAPRTIDNMEGLAVRSGQNGRDYVYLISDDNFSPVQRTLLLMFELDPDDLPVPPVQ